jgi:hypothetical protein
MTNDHGQEVVAQDIEIDQLKNHWKEQLVDPLVHLYQHLYEQLNTNIKFI